MVKRRAKRAGLSAAEISPHSADVRKRAAGVTEFLRNGGELEVAARMSSQAH